MIDLNQEPQPHGAPRRPLKKERPLPRLQPKVAFDHAVYLEWIEALNAERRALKKLPVTQAELNAKLAGYLHHSMTTAAQMARMTAKTVTGK